MLTANTQFETELRKRVNAVIEELKNNLANGTFDRDEYMRVCGEVAGLRKVFGICDDVQEHLANR